MKTKALIPFISVALLISTYGANNDVKNPASTEKKAEPANNSSAPGDWVGEWEMVGSVVDTNDNLQIDEAERRILKPTMKDYMKLNRDGSGVFTVAKMPGRFEITTTGGKKYLTWYDKANGRHRVGTIIKVTREELHIKEPGGHGLFIWKRLS